MRGSDSGSDGSTAPKVPSSSNLATGAPKASGSVGQPQPVPSTSNSTGGTAAMQGSSEDDYLKPIPYNPPSRPAGLDQAQRQEQTDEQAWQKASTPLNRADYKPSVGRRVLGGLAGAMVGFGSRNPEAGFNIASGVVNQPYNRAEQAREQAMETTGQTLSNDRQSANQQDRDYENSLTQYDRSFNAQNLAQDRAARAASLGAEQRATQQQKLAAIAPGTQQPDDPNNPMGSWHAVTVGGKKVAMTGPPDSWLKTPQGIDAQRDSEVRRLGLAGNDAKFYRANGKLREPSPTTNIRIPSEGFQQYEDWRSTFKRDNGREPNASEIAEYGKKGRAGGSGSPGLAKSLADRIESQKNTAINKARQNFGDGKDPSYTRDDYLDDWQAAQDNYEDRISTAVGHDVPHVNIRDHVDAKGNWKTEPPASPSSPAQAQPAAAPGIPNGGGKQLDRATAAAILKAVGGDKDKARELAKKSNWKF